MPNNKQLKKINNQNIFGLGGQIIGMGGIVKDYMSHQEASIQTDMNCFCQGVRLQKEIAESNLPADEKEKFNKKIDISLEQFLKNTKSCMVSRSVVMWTTLGLAGIYAIIGIVNAYKKGSANGEN